MLVLNLTKTVIIFTDPYPVIELSHLEHAEFLQSLVDEWNQAPITSMEISKEACDEPAFTRTWHGTLEYKYESCARGVNCKKTRRPS